MNLYCRDPDSSHRPHPDSPTPVSSNLVSPNPVSPNPNSPKENLLSHRKRLAPTKLLHMPGVIECFRHRGTASCTMKSLIPVSCEVMSHAFVEHPYTCVTMPLYCFWRNNGPGNSVEELSLSMTPKKMGKQDEPKENSRVHRKEAI